MISNLEHTALEFLKHSTSSLKALIIFGGIVYMFSTGYCIQLQLVGSFSFFILCFARCLRCRDLALSSSWSGGSVQVEVLTGQLHLRMFLSPHPPQRTSQVFMYPEPCQLLITRVYDKYCIRFLCQPSSLIL